MRVLFVDDEPDRVEPVARTLREGLGIDARVVDSVEAAVAVLHEAPVDLVVADVFLPLGDTRPRGALGPRAHRHARHLAHLGGLLLLDEIERMQRPPRLLAHTACTDFDLLEVLGGMAHARVPKPAPHDRLLRAVLEALDLPVPG